MTSFFTFDPLEVVTTGRIRSTFDEMSERLGPVDEQARLGFRIIGEDGESVFIVSTGSSRKSRKQADAPDFELITNETTWLEIASGTLAPLRAFLEGRMRVRGDIALGERLLAELSLSRQSALRGEDDHG